MSTDTAVKPTEKTTEKKDATKRLGRSKVYSRRFFRNKGAVIGLVIFALLLVLGVVGEIVVKSVNGWTFDSTDFLNLSQPPSADHWFGSTLTGGDLFAQVAHGLQRSLIIAVVVSGLTTLIAAFVGAFAAFAGGKVEKAILWVIHFLLVVPSFLILALIANSHSGSIAWLIFALVALGWMYSARVIWSLSMSLRERDYVTSARYMGVPSVKIVFRHMIPNIGSL